MSSDNSQKDFNKYFENTYKENCPNFDEHVNIALVGKVSAGKSSLLNAILDCSREEPIAEVGAGSGVTTKVTPFKLDEHVLIIDCPGLDDVRQENSDVTVNFLNSIDLGIFVVTGSADASQKENFDDLNHSSKKTFVVLNKIDEWDDLEESAYEEVVKQWKSVLGVEQIYGTCTKGFDPKMKKSAPMDIRGVEELKIDIFNFLETEGKDILLARHLKNKEKYAIGIIATAILAVTGEAFVPGSAAYITATQVVALTSLNYLYTGEVLSKGSALSLLPSFVGQSIGTNAFLWAKSFLPPTLILDMTAAIIAVIITFAMLAAVKWMLENEQSLSDRELLKKTFLHFKKLSDIFKDIQFNDLKNKNNIIALLGKLLAK